MNAESKKLNDTEDVSVHELAQRLHRLLSAAERDEFVKEEIKDAVIRIENRKSAADMCSVFDD